MHQAHSGQKATHAVSYQCQPPRIDAEAPHVCRRAQILQHRLHIFHAVGKRKAAPAAPRAAIMENQHIPTRAA